MLRVPHSRSAVLVRLRGFSICSRCWSQATVVAAARKPRRPLYILGIETSCDDTCVAVLRVTPASPPLIPNFPSSSYIPTASLLLNKKITSNHLGWGGIHPVVAVRAHRTNLPSLVSSAMAHFNNNGKDRPDLIAVTRGPGQMNALDVGLHFAKGLAFAWNVPIVGVNHMQAHALTVRLVGAMGRGYLGSIEKIGSSSSTGDSIEGSDDYMGERGYPNYPFLSLLVSGGHTLLVLSKSLTEHKVLVDTLDTAVGDAVDKIARIVLPKDLLDKATNTNFGRLLEEFVFPSPSDELTLPFRLPSDESMYPFAYDRAVPEEEKIEKYGYDPTDKTRDNSFLERYGWTLPKPLEGQTMEHRSWMKFSFAGLRAHLDRNLGIELEKPAEESIVNDNFRKELGWLAQKRAFEHLAGRVLLGLQKLHDEDNIEIKDLVVSGGVASNKFLRYVLKEYLRVKWGKDMRLHYPPVDLCTDNAAMIAWTGYEMYDAGWESELNMAPLRKWALDEDVEDEDKGKYADRDNVAFGLMQIEGWKKREETEIKTKEEKVISSIGRNGKLKPTKRKVLTSWKGEDLIKSRQPSEVDRILRNVAYKGLLDEVYKEVVRKAEKVGLSMEELQLARQRTALSRAVKSVKPAHPPVRSGTWRGNPQRENINVTPSTLSKESQRSRERVSILRTVKPAATPITYGDPQYWLRQVDSSNYPKLRHVAYDPPPPKEQDIPEGMSTVELNYGYGGRSNTTTEVEISNAFDSTDLYSLATVKRARPRRIRGKREVPLVRRQTGDDS